MNLKNFRIGWQELAFRFSAFTPGVHSCIIGTSNIEHLHQNIELVQKGRLPEEIILHIRDAFKKNDFNWTGQI